MISDDHAIFRAGLRKLLEAEPDFAVVGEASSGDRVAPLIEELRPDLVLLDVSMPGMNGIEVMRELFRRRTSVRVVMLTASISPAQIADALNAGARGVLMKTAATELLFECIRSVANGQYWVGRDHVGSLVEALATSRITAPRWERPFGLTRRELEVIEHVSEGCANQEIANRLAISEDTVKHHLSRIFDKTGTSSRVELALFAHHNRLIGETSRDPRG